MERLEITSRHGNAVGYRLTNEDGLVTATAHIADASEFIAQARASRKSLASVIAASLTDRKVEAVVLPHNPDGEVSRTHTHEEFSWGVPDHDHPIIPHQHQHNHEEFAAHDTHIKELARNLGAAIGEYRDSIARHDHPLPHHQHPLLDASISALEAEIGKLARHTHGEYAQSNHTHVQFSELADTITNLNANLANLRNQLDAHAHEQKVYAEVDHGHEIAAHKHEGQGCPHENLYFLAEENTNGRPRRIYRCDQCQFTRSMWEAPVVGR